MELHPRVLIYQRSSWPFFFFFVPSNSSPPPPPPPPPPPNHVHWTQTPHSHLFTADLPGVRKEEIRVEVEDSLYMVIRTELVGDGDGDGDGGDDDGGERRRGFMRKFRLPRLVDLDHISAGYENGVLTVTVPRMISAGGRLRVDPREFPEERNSVARAA